MSAAPHLADPRSAYVHVPFCAHRCGYCDFALVANRRDLIPKYLEAVRIELSRLDGPAEIDTLFLGGGTPTQLGPDGLERLFEILLDRFSLADDFEWTIEANPNDVDESICQVLAAAGVNRVSLGAQSFRADKLAALDRQHSVAETQRAIERSRAFAEVSLDLIFAAPEESLTDWQADLDLAIQQQPDHLSTYGLTYEKGTRFHTALLKSAWAEVAEGTQHQMYQWTIDRLTAIGMDHYEVSSFARPGRRCRHNQVYWTGRPFFGIGPGAASYVDGVRRTNHRSPTTFIQRTLAGEMAVAETEHLDAEGIARERLVFGLRRLEGVSRQDFLSETGFDVVQLGADPLQQFLHAGLLTWQGDHLALTRKGLLVSDSLWPELISA